MLACSFFLQFRLFMSLGLPGIARYSDGHRWLAIHVTPRARCFSWALVNPSLILSFPRP